MRRTIVAEDGIVANLADGVLTVRVPIPESERPRRIAVH
jgi:HSP20 family molecular chaperone IbpA